MPARSLMECEAWLAAQISNFPPTSLSAWLPNSCTGHGATDDNEPKPTAGAKKQRETEA